MFNLSKETRQLNRLRLANTIEEINNNPKILEAISKSKVAVFKDTKTTKENPKYNTKISFNHNSTVETILGIDNTDTKVCALIFSSESFNNNTGCGIHQEDTILRTSTMYKLIDTAYTLKNYYSFNKQNENNSRCIYLSKVLFFKNEDDIKLDDENQKVVDLILSTPPNQVKEDLSNEASKSIIYKKLKNLFNVAIEKKVEILILGAYGCGSYENSPTIVSKIFKSLIDEYNGYFKEIIFSIKSKDDFDTNYSVFKKNILGI